MRLNWGCGGVIAAGWVNSDRGDNGQEHVGDIADGLPWCDGTFDAMVANHSLQMLDHGDVVPALRELRRVLTDESVLRILVPDALGAFEAYRRGDESWFPRFDGRAESLAGRFCSYLTDYSQARSLFTREWLIELCGAAGFAEAHVASPGFSPFGVAGICDLDSRCGESIVVEARR